jgi:hypothetical protein
MQYACPVNLPGLPSSSIGRRRPVSPAVSHQYSKRSCTAPSAALRYETAPRRNSRTRIVSPPPSINSHASKGTSSAPTAMTVPSATS